LLSRIRQYHDPRDDERYQTHQTRRPRVTRREGGDNTSLALCPKGAASDRNPKPLLRASNSGVDARVRRLDPPGNSAVHWRALLTARSGFVADARHYSRDKRLQTTSGRGPVLRQVADGVLIHQSEFCQSNTVVVQGRAGVLVIDPGVRGDEMACLASDLSDLGQTVVAGFSTHPHWDHLLWHASLGAAPRYGTARCAATVRDRLSDARAKARIAELIPPDIVEQVPLDLLGLITGLPAETEQIPWDGSQVRIIEHQAHAPGHAALLIEERGVLVAGDTLSDVLIPLLDQNDTADPIEDYLAALRLLEGVADGVDVVVPGHGSIGGADQIRARIEQDRAYLHALCDAQVVSDPRVGTSATYDWLPGVHERQLHNLARRRERDGTPG
jgi:glyoxylase-like metal-dependent hydrolase (beta-lactamase superfamily II)